MSSVLKEGLRQTGRTTDALLSIDKFPAVFVVENHLQISYTYDLAQKHLKMEGYTRVGQILHTAQGDIFLCTKEQLTDPYKFRGLGIKKITIDHYANECPWTAQQREGLWDLKAQLRRG